MIGSLNPAIIFHRMVQGSVRSYMVKSKPPGPGTNHTYHLCFSQHGWSRGQLGQKILIVDMSDHDDVYLREHHSAHQGFRLFASKTSLTCDYVLPIVYSPNEQRYQHRLGSSTFFVSNYFAQSLRCDTFFPGLDYLVPRSNPAEIVSHQA